MLLSTFLVLFVEFILGNHRTYAQDLLSFELRHHHAVSGNAHVIFSDTKPSSFQEPFKVRTRRHTTYRPSSFDNFSAARLLKSRGQGHLTSSVLGWEEDEVLGPDVEKRETLLTIAKMANNAYVMDPSDAEWYDLGGNWTSVCTPFRSRETMRCSSLLN